MYDKLVWLLNSQRSEKPVNVNMLGVSVNSSCVNMSSFGWILHSGAIIHMVFDLNMLFNIKDASNSALFVNWPNGSIVHVQLIGSWQFSPNIMLKRVLFVSDFKFNLLSISRLAFDNNFVIKSFSHSFVVQNFSTKMILTIGKQINGLYYFSIYKGGNSLDSYLTYVNSVNTWHDRL